MRPVAQTLLLILDERSSVGAVLLYPLSFPMCLHGLSQKIVAGRGSAHPI